MALLTQVERQREPPIPEAPCSAEPRRDRKPWAQRAQSCHREVKGVGLPAVQVLFNLKTQR